MGEDDDEIEFTRRLQPPLMSTSRPPIEARVTTAGLGLGDFVGTGITEDQAARRALWFALKAHREMLVQLNAESITRLLDRAGIPTKEGKEPLSLFGRVVALLRLYEDALL